MNRPVDTSSWTPSKTPQVFLHTLEAADCSQTPFSCNSTELRTYLTSARNVRASYEVFDSAKTLFAGLDRITDCHRTLAPSLKQDDSLVIQLSVHGVNFRTISFGGIVTQLDAITTRYFKRLTPNTVLLLNQCWGGWPTWSRLFRHATSSPRLIFGSVKRFGTSVNALNSAEFAIIRWLAGAGDVGAHAQAMPDLINERIGCKYEGHQQFYRGWYWSHQNPKPNPPLLTAGLGLPDIRNYFVEVGDTVVHIAVESGGGADNMVKAKLPGKPLMGAYSYRVDSAVSGTSRKHIHVFMHRNQLFALNFDGTAHDDSHQTKIPKKVASKLRELFPKLSIPEDDFIKSIFSLT